MVNPQVMDGRDGFVLRVAINTLNKQSWTANKRWCWGLGTGPTTLHHKKPLCYKMLNGALVMMDSLERPIE